MQPKSRADDEDMSMEEILASIRKYVTDDYSSKSTEQKSSERSSGHHSAHPPKDTKDNHMIAPNPTYEAAPSPSFTGGIAPDAHVPTTEDDIVDLVDSIDDTLVKQHPDIIELATPVAESRPYTPIPVSSPTSKHPELYALISEEQNSVEVPSDQTPLNQQTHSYSPPQATVVFTEKPEAETSLNDLTATSPSCFAEQNHAAETSEKHNALLEQSQQTPTYSSSKMEAISMTTNIQTVSDGLSQETVSASASAFSRLAQAVKPQQATHTTSTNLVAPQPQTLDVFMAGLVQPMIKEWMDKNLTKIVEQSVEKEIQKITKTMIGG